MKRTGKTRSGERIDLYIDDENRQYAVCWFDLCGYDMVVLRFGSGDDAEAFFNAVQLVEEVEAE